jgi:hypothetical protein
MRSQLVVLLGLIAAIAGFEAYYSLKTPDAALRQTRTAEVYTAILEKIISRDSSNIEQIYLFQETDAGAVPTVQARLREGLSEEQAKGGLEHQRAKFDRAMGQLRAKPETLADFEASNSAPHLLDLPLKLSRPYHWVRLNLRGIPRGQLVIGFSDVGFDREMDEAVVTLNSFMMRSDYRLTRTAEHQWKIAECSGGRFVMD